MPDYYNYNQNSGQQPMYNPPQYQPQASLFTCGIGAIVMFIWGIVDGVRILDGRINTDANGVFLKD